MPTTFPQPHMPLLTRLYVKTALVYFVLALVAGVLLELGFAISNLRPIYLHLLMVGWLAQFIMGVAFWMFPKLTREQPRGHEWLAWVIYVLLNLGLVLRVIGEPLLLGDATGRVGLLLAVSAILQMLAGWGFVFNTWGRVKGR